MGVVGTVLSATIFGVLTTALVGSIGGSREIALADLPRHRVATLKDSTAQSFLEQFAADEAAKGSVRAARRESIRASTRSCRSRGPPRRPSAAASMPRPPTPARAAWS